MSQTITLTAKSIASEHAYYSESGSYPLSNILNVTSEQGTKYGGMDLTRGANSESYFFAVFDTSDIPQNATIVRVTASMKIYGSTTAQGRTQLRELQLYSGNSPKGEAIAYTLSGNSVTFSISEGGTWTRGELSNIRLRCYAMRNSSGTSSSTYVYAQGCDVTIEYEESQSGGGGGGDEPSGEAMPFGYTGAVQQTTLPKGKYRLQVWGAQGGSYDSYNGGKGGYAEGVIELAQATGIYVYVGGQPTTVSTARAKVNGGFNGGGNGQNRDYSNVYTYGQGGGGGTDIRIGSDSLYARVIVAGGGGGSASSSNDNNNAKYGGGTKGGSGGQSASASYNAGQTAGSTSGNYLAGAFGNGANAYTSKTNYQHGSGGGGGGWYGGYAYNQAADNSQTLKDCNGGGSGYVYTQGTASSYPSGCLLGSGHYLTEAQTIGGNAQMPSPSGGTETGHEGHGYVMITPIVEVQLPPVWIKTADGWRQAVAVYRKQDGQWAETSDYEGLTNN